MNLSFALSCISFSLDRFSWFWYLDVSLLCMLDSSSYCFATCVSACVCCCCTWFFCFYFSSYACFALVFFFGWTGFLGILFFSFFNYGGERLSRLSLVMPMYPMVWIPRILAICFCNISDLTWSTSWPSIEFLAESSWAFYLSADSELCCLIRVFNVFFKSLIWSLLSLFSFWRSSMSDLYETFKSLNRVFSSRSW